MFSRHIAHTVQYIAKILSILEEYYLFTFKIDTSQLDHLEILVSFPKKTKRFTIELADDDIREGINCIWKNSATNYEKKTLFYNVRSIM
jgi:hypothetical protein